MTPFSLTLWCTKTRLSPSMHTLVSWCCNHLRRETQNSVIVNAVPARIPLALIVPWFSPGHRVWHCSLVVLGNCSTLGVIC
jgi:hypothetical protein